MTNPVPHSHLRLRYCKDEVLQYVGHRDMLRLILRVLRQAEVPYAMSGGYSPKPKVSFAPALPLGVMADNELVDIELAEGTVLSASDLVTTGQRIGAAVQPRRFMVGLDLLPPHSPSLAHAAVLGRYELEFNSCCDELASVVSADSMPFEHKDNVIDLRPAIQRWELDGMVLHMDANVSTPPILNIVRLADYIEDHTGLTAAVITRRCLLDASSHPL